MAQQQKQQPAVEIEIPEQVPGPPGGVDWGKIMQYASVTMQIASKVEAVQVLEPGECEELGEIKFRRGGKSYTLELGELCRTA